MAGHLLNHLQHCNLTFAGMLAVNSLLLLCVYFQCLPFPLIVVVNCLTFKKYEVHKLNSLLVLLMLILLLFIATCFAQVISLF